MWFFFLEHCKRFSHLNHNCLKIHISFKNKDTNKISLKLLNGSVHGILFILYIHLKKSDADVHALRNLPNHSPPVWVLDTWLPAMKLIKTMRILLLTQLLIPSQSNISDVYTMKKQSLNIKAAWKIIMHVLS